MFSVKKIFPSRRIFNSALILLIITLFAIRNHILSAIFIYPFGIDSMGHVYNALRIQDCLRDFIVPGNGWEKLLFLLRVINWDIYRPPLYYFLSLAVDLFVDDLIITQLYVLPVIFLSVLLFYSCKISEFFAKNSGIFAVLFLSLFPGIVNYSAGINLYLAEAAFTAMALFYLLKSDVFENRRCVILCGAAFMLGMLVKRQFIIFLAGPLLVSVFTLLRAGGKNARRNFFIFTVCFLVPVLVIFFIPQLKRYCLIWPFVPRLPHYARQILLYGTALSANTSWFFLSLFLVSWLLLYRQKIAYLRQVFFLFAGMFVLFPWFALPEGQHLYHVFPVVPLIAVIPAVYLARLKKSTALTALILAAALQAGFLTKIDREFFQCRFIPAHNMLAFLHEQGVSSQSNKKLSMLAQDHDYQLDFDLPVLLMLAGFRGYAGEPGYPNGKIFQKLKECDYFIYVSGDINSDWPSRDVLLKHAAGHSGITAHEVDRILMSKNEFSAVGTYPYFISIDGALLYVNVFVRTGGKITQQVVKE